MVLHILSHIDGMTLLGLASLTASFLFSLAHLCIGLRKRA